MPKRKRAKRLRVAATLLFINGFIFISYAALVPTYVRGVHLLITLAAALFIASLPGLHYSMRRMKSAAERIITILFGFGMVTLILSDYLFASSFLSGLTHDAIYATGNALLLLYVLTVAIASLKGLFNKWLGYVSLLTLIIGISSYTPLAPRLLPPASLVLIGAWCIALGLSLLAKQRPRDDKDNPKS